MLMEGPLPPELTEDLRELMVLAIRRAYAECMQRFDRSVGFTNQTFGQMVFRSAWYFLGVSLQAKHNVRSLRPDGGFEIHVGPISLAPYKVPLDEGGVAPGLPRNEARLAAMAENAAQPQLFEGLRQTKFILAHVGDPLLGLRAVYVGAPIRGTSEDTYEWAWIVRIDRSQPAVDLPEPVEIPVPEVAPLRRKGRARRAPTSELA